MSDYYDEMGWQPVELERTSHHQQLLFARALLDSGFLDLDMLDGEQLAPPASKAFVRELPEKTCGAADEPCAICLRPNDEQPTKPGDDGDDDDDGEQDEADGGLLTDDAGRPLFKVLPCSHAFHKRCIMPWLDKTNSCPLCRREMLTDDQAYENRKKQRVREADRYEEVMNSMYG